jgi:photosystem II stability/assembly factor-like uncharacterized protein
MRHAAIWLTLCGLSGCGGAATDKGGAGSDDGSSDGSDGGADSGAPGDSGAPDPSACEDVSRPPLSPSTWVEGGDIPGGGVWSIVQGPGGVPLYAGSHNSGLWSSVDGGETWLRGLVRSTHTLAELALSPDDPSRVYRSSGGVLERSDDGGLSWTVLPLGGVSETAAEEVYALAVAPYDARRVYGVLSTGGAYRSTDAGDSFELQGALPVLVDVGAGDPFLNHDWHLLPDVEAGGRVLFADGDMVQVSDDGMVSWGWTLVGTVGLGGRSLRRDPLDPDHILIGAEDGLYESFDEGDTWARRDELGPALQMGAWAEDGSWLAYASADTLYVSTDSGATWVARALDWPMVEALAIVGDRLILSWNDGLVSSDDGGLTWSDDDEGLTDPGMAVLAPHPVCANRLFAASRCSGGVYRSDDYGSTWSHVEAYFHYVMGLHFDPQDPETVWAISDDSLLVSRDGGSSWSQAVRKYHFHGFAVHPDDSDTLLLGSVGSGEWADDTMRVYRTEDGGESWTDASAGLPTSEASAHTLLYWPDNPEVVLLGTYKGEDPSHFSGFGVGLFRSEDGGQSWTESPLPAVDVAWLSPCPGGVVATTEDGLYRSRDEGRSWERLLGPEGLLLSADFAGELGLTLGQDGRVWRSDDGGDTWARFDIGLTSNPTSFLASIAISADGETAWVTVFDDGVYRIALE